MRGIAQISQIAGMSDVHFMGGFGMGAGAQLRGQRLNGFGDVLIEQKPDPCRQPQNRQSRHQPSNHKARQNLWLRKAHIAQDQPARDQRNPTQCHQGKEQKNPQPE